MKNKSCIYTVFLFFLLTNCTYPSASQSEIQSSPSAIPIVGSTPTKLTAPSAIPLATFTATESPIVGSGSLSALGSPPYLVYVKKVNHKEQVVLVNQDGSGSKTIPLPANGFNAGNPSPTGEWLVFYTGSGGMQTLTDGPEYDLALNLMHLPDGATRKITNLLSKDFPANLEKFAEMAKSNNSELSSIDTKTIAEQARQTLIYRLMLGQWLPSGEAFAFAGEMYGPSTDLYLYNVKTDNFQRLSSGSRNIDFIKWFPNGEKILYGSSYLPCLGDCSTYFVTSLDGLDSKELQGFETFGGSTKMGDWFGDEFLTMYTTANVSGDCCLRNYDFENDKVNMLFAGSFQNYAYDPKTNLLAISVRGNPDDVLSGTYFIDQSGMRKVDEAGLVYYLGWRDYPFILAAGSTKLLSTSGESKTLAEIELVPFASRNNKYVALCDSEWSQTTNGLRVFDNDGNLVFEIKDQKITKVVWRIDSRGLFYVANNQLYYVEIQDKLSVLIDSHLNDEEFETMYMTFNWVR